MAFMEILKETISIVFVPAIVVSALLSVITANAYKDIVSTGGFHWFKNKLKNIIGDIIDHCIEYLVALIFASSTLFVIILLLILLYLLGDFITNLL